MPRLKKVVVLLFVAMVALVPLSVGGTYLYFRPGLPAASGRLTASGLKAATDVVRDRWGVPHILAQDEDDLFFAQGYVQAQDRLWQMELARRTAHGTLAEVLGAQAVASDRLARTLGFTRGAEREWEVLDPDAKRALEAYARGVNAYLAAPGRQLPPEFALLGYRPTPWQPLDSVAWARLVAWSQSTTWQREVLRARLVSAVGPERAAQLEPGGQGAVDLPGELLDIGVAAQPLLLEDGELEWPWAVAANSGTCWAVTGESVSAGRAILAGDLSSPAQMPSLWYEMHLQGGRYDVIGATLPGVPGVVSGRNPSIAWSSISAAADVEDLYVERIRRGDPSQVEYKGQWENVGVSTEEIQVRGESGPRRFLVYTTRHGPLVSALDSGREEQIALRWVGADQPTAFLRCLLALNRAVDWDQFRAVLRDWTVPVQTLVYADVNGNIGSVVAGTVPVRMHGDGSLPVPGWTGQYEWNGFISPDALPAERNPKAGIVVAVSSSLASEGYPEIQTKDAASAYRSRRIQDLVRAQRKLTAESARAIQNDLQGPPQPLLALLLALPPQGWIQERTTPYLRSWDLRYDAESAGAGVYESYYWRLVHNTFDDELGVDLVASYLNLYPDHRRVMEELSTQPDNPWFDDIRTPQRERRDEIMARSYAEALEWLGRRFGDLPYEWNWGRVHAVTFRHALGREWPETVLLNRGAMRAGGSPFCVTATDIDYAQPLAVQTMPSCRLVIDLGEGGQSLTVIAAGQSGHPGSRHYADLIQPWREGSYHPLLFERQAILAARESQLTLVPAD